MDESHDAVVQPHVHANTFTRTLVHGVEMVPHLNRSEFKNGSKPKHIWTLNYKLITKE